MNILVLNWRDMKHPEAGGAEIHLVELFSRLVEKGHQVILLTTKFKNSPDVDEQKGIKVIRKGHSFLFNWQAPFLIRKIIKSYSIDCIIDDVNKIPFFTPRWFPDMPCGVIFHHLFGKTVFELVVRPLADYVLFLENMSRWGYSSVPCVTVSNSTKDELVHKGFDDNKIKIIYNSVDVEAYTPCREQKSNENVLLYVGRLKRYKQVDLIFDAAKKLIDAGIELKVVVAGTGDDEEHLKEHAQQLKIADRITFFGYCDESQKIDLYRRATLFVNPSQKEGWGITNIEANACGTAVIANDTAGQRDSVVNGKTGLLFKENDVNDLTESIKSLLLDAARRTTMEEQGRAWALGFSWEQSARELDAWISEIVARKRAK